MPNKNGYDTLLEIKKYWPEQKVIIYTMFGGDLNASRYFAKGANAFVSKSSDPDILKKAIETVYSDDFYLDLDSGQHLLIRKTYTNRVQEITETEQQFIKLCATELTYKEMAVQMKTSEENIHTIRDNLYAKFNVHNRPKLVIIGIILGIVLL